jgi:2'-5' RNA ligase
MYVWHILFDDQPVVGELVRECQARIDSIPGLDPVPAAWLHLTTQVVGFADEISEPELRGMIEATRERLRSLDPVAVGLGRPLFHAEGLALGVSPPRALHAIRAEIRDSVATAVRANRLADEPEWTPHVSVAYSNSDAPVAPVVAAMRPPPTPVDVRIGAVHLVSQRREGHAYVWDRVEEIRLGHGL